jgi:hypothetical protein
MIHLSNEKSPTAVKTKQFCLKKFNKILYLSILLCFGYYMCLMNGLSIRGFEMKAARQKLNKITVENQDLELEIMNLESYRNLNGKIGKLGLVKVDKINYLNVTGGSVARK